MGITRNAIAAEIREWRQYKLDDARWHAECAARYPEGEVPDYHRPKSRATLNAEARELSWSRTIPACGAGQYDMAYYPEHDDDLIGNVLCAECARQFVRDNRDYALHAEHGDGYEGDDSADHLYCDDCGKVIIRAWLRPPGHRDDADLPWSLLRQLRAEESGVPLDSRKRYTPRHWDGRRRDRRFRRRYQTRVATLAIRRYRALVA